MSSRTGNNNVALITGASSGIGKELAIHHAEAGGDCILVARRKPALDKLKAELESKYSGVTAYVVTADLSKAGAAEKLHKDVKELKVDVKVLINNAGFGGQGSIVDREVADDVNMIMVNVVAATVLVKLFAADMVKLGGGKILNVGSTAGFIPGPYQAVYFATKAYLNSFSQAVDEELREKGVSSTVLCPGLVNTEFVKVAGLDGTNMVKQQAGATPTSVAKIGYNAMLKKQLLVINEYGLSFLLNWVTPLMPRRWLLKLSASSQKK